jgi:glycosyltransferase involved in cell wall biosynthesis
MAVPETSEFAPAVLPEPRGRSAAGAGSRRSGRFAVATSYQGKSVPDYFFALAEELARRSHAVTIIVDGRRDDVMRSHTNPAVLSWPSKRPTRWRDAAFLRRIVEERGVEVLISNFGAVNICLLAGMVSGVPRRVAWHHTLTNQVELDHECSALRRAFHIWRKRFVLRLATDVVVSSRAAALDLRERFGVPEWKCCRLPLMIPDPCRGETIRHRNRIVCAARLFPSKGQEVLIRATSQLVVKYPDLVVEFLGSGPDLERCRHLAASLGVADQCRFLGHCALQEVLDRMASAAVCVSPSLEEAYGLANVESQAVGTPVVASAAGGITEIVVDGETGLLVPPGDPKALASGLDLLLGDDELRERLGRGARRHFERNFCTEGIGRHADVFESMLP